MPELNSPTAGFPEAGTAEVIEKTTHQKLLDKGTEWGRDVKHQLKHGTANVMLVDNSKDIYTNYRWGVKRPKQDYITEVPIIILTEYQPTGGPLLEDVNYAFKIVKAGFDKVVRGKNVDAYQNIYKGALTGNVFNLPFFSDYNHQVGSTWSDGASWDKVNTLFTAVETGMSLFNRGVIEKRRNWQGTSQAHYTFNFTLYNTYDPDDIMKNLQLVRALIYNNLPTRTGFATMLPPCFYKLEIPGVRYAPVVALEGINVENIGQVNRKQVYMQNIDNTGRMMDVNIPDAWRVSISVHELHTESREIYDSLFSNEDNRITIIDEETKSDEDSKLNKVSVIEGVLKR